VPVLTSAQLYLASPAEIVAQVQRLTDASVPPPQHVVVVAHNPGLEELALWLVQPERRDDYEAMATKFPTSAVAQITVAADDWRQMSVGSGSAQLRSFTIARG
jgi:phosphohistidine phosphatase